MKSYEIHFIRHGSISESSKGAYIGSTDVPLSASGISALKKLDEENIYPGTPKVFSSPLLRCIQTCNIIYPQIKPTVIKDFAECSFGDWEGKTALELADDERFKKWLANSQTSAPPNGESGEIFTRRICLAFESLVKQLMSSGETTAVVVTHGGVIMTLLSVYGLPHSEPYNWRMDNGYGFSVRINPGLWMRDKVAEVYAKIPKQKEELL